MLNAAYGMKKREKRHPKNAPATLDLKHI